jgi:hypothetical protein
MLDPIGEMLPEDESHRRWYLQTSRGISALSPDLGGASAHCRDGAPAHTANRALGLRVAKTT